MLLRPRVTSKEELSPRSSERLGQLMPDFEENWMAEYVEAAALKEGEVA